MNQRFSGVAVFIIAMLANGASLALTPSVPSATTTSEPAVAGPEIPHNGPQPENCIKQTGSHIAVKDGSVCNGQIGSAYTQDDIDRTGAITTAGALQSLDIAVQIRR